MSGTKNIGEWTELTTVRCPKCNKDIKVIHYLGGTPQHVKHECRIVHVPKPPKEKKPKKTKEEREAEKKAKKEAKQKAKEENAEK